MISVNALTVEFAAQPLFNNISYVINPRDKIALVGRNGAGKSTMLKIILGLQKPTSGNVSMPSDITIGYLPQVMNIADDTTVLDEVKKAFSHIDELRRQEKELADALATRTDYDSEAYSALIQRLSEQSERVAIAESENGDAEAEKTLLGLGFRRDDFNRATSEFSGGWRMRIELAKILLRRPDVLLLDEPTNHLDIESIQWLENFLITKARAVVLVSHDRAFLDNVTKRTIEISMGRIYDYAVPYTRFLDLRAERIEQQMRAYRNQQKMISDTEEFIERFRYKATKAVQVQSRMKQLDKIERIEVDQVDKSKLSLRFPPAPRSGDFPVICDNVGKAYGNHQVFDNCTLTLRRGEKVAFVGRNGEGKSTLVKCIMGEIEHTGVLKIGHNVHIGYFAQNQAQLLDGDVTVFDTIDRVAVGDIRTKIRDILGAFMFGGEASDKKVKVLSGGERSRLAMIRLLLEPVNLLILDEPTNHLDIPSKEVLKQAIKNFDGTVIVVSHDRDFLDGLVERVYEFGEGKVREYIGGIYDWLSTRRDASIAANSGDKNTATAKEKLKTEDTSQATPDTNKQKTPNKPLNYALQREREKAIRRARKAVEEAESAVTKAENTVREIEELIASGNVTDEKVYTQHAEAQKYLENCMSIWELSVQRLEEIEQN